MFSINFCGFYFFKHTLPQYDKNCQSRIYLKAKKNSKSMVHSNTISFAKIDYFWHGKIEFKLLKTFLKKDVSKCVQSIERHTTLFDKEVEFVSVKFKCVSIFLPVFSGIKVYKKSYCIELNKREVIRDIFHFLISILRHKPKHVLTAFSFCELYVINSYVAFVIRSIIMESSGVFLALQVVLKKSKFNMYI